jgi:hypothetical protein
MDIDDPEFIMQKEEKEKPRTLGGKIINKLMKNEQRDDNILV